MTTLAEQSMPSTSSSASPMSNINACYDPDIDSFINLDQLTYTSADSARPKPALISQPSVASSESSTGDIGTNSQPQIPFPGPSHQYDDHKQQTPLPPGGLAHAMAFSNNNGMNFTMGAQGFPINGNVYGGMSVKHEETPIDFGSVPARNPSEMDLDFFSNQPNRNQFVDPNALGGHELSPVGPPAQVGRMYPGMHQQQAAMAKAAQQQRQHEMMRQQQQFQQRRMEEQARQTGRQARPNRHPDPVVEERISRLLQQMRQSSVTSQEDASPPSILPQMAKAKKDEEEMDEDERLLASEEGKKLSSKERRQLRNKVSARAFRSRRKEYIGQLEGEVAVKTNEANELRMQNRALFEENARLTDLTRMLLSSPHFSSFLNDFSLNGIPSSQPQQQQQVQPAVVSQPQMQQNHQKDVNPARVAQDFQMQQNPQVGMVMVPEQSVNVPTMDMNPSGWNSGIDMNFTNAPVFAVFEVPEPVIDTGVLCGKSSNFVGSEVLETSKDEVPSLERPPVPEAPKEKTNVGTPNPDVEIDESDPAFALFLDSPPASQSSSPEKVQNLFDGVESEKVLSTFELVVEDESTEVSAVTMRRFERLCHSMEAAFQRVSMVTAHLV
ncbi:transcriptional regulator family: bZIP [Paecilomyces variotii]|nr:transcriptional regulator family: bZIP [Paecilomyces variotii]KAJ9248290.1 transcriptional regulator family: bZIP [Paecilomyces variotii]KAJ9307099.1 transcriptional regulator family: bZIP [Paecilomyces variotii]KAJ9375870.1 transcriptional regulator family: bZIP [Paecilomyces variotii]KAJ9403293.1 transcriptional regulator family: bZIP [Paecilomyces variotii]